MSLEVNSELHIDAINVYGVEKEVINKGDQCDFEAPYKTLNVFGEPYNWTENHPNLIINDLKKVNRNHIEANKRKGFNFYVYDNEGRLILYINKSMIEKIEELTEKNEYKKGDVSVQYNTLLTFKENLIEVNEINAKFVKADDPAEPYYFGSIEDIKEVIKNLRKLNRAEAWRIKFYQDKLEQGYKYIVYQITKKSTNQLKIIRYVDHHEKTPERQQRENLITDLKLLNRDWREYEIEKLLDNYEVNKK